MVPLSSDTEERLKMLFRADVFDEARKLLEDDCADNLPFCEKSTPRSLERLRYAVMKLSGGDLYCLIEAIVGAQTDWRDTLVAAGFGEDVRAHERWMPQ